MNVRGDEKSVTNSGRLFHARGPATAKAIGDEQLARKDALASYFRSDVLVQYAVGLVHTEETS